MADPPVAVKPPLKDRNRPQRFCAPEAPRQNTDGDFLLSA
jgi:hypothetical protein